MANHLLSLQYEPSLEGLGSTYWDVVEPAQFPLTKLRFRNNPLFRELGIDIDQVDDNDIEEAFGKFEGRTPFLALRYHGYQFQTYNPFLGDGRGFLYGQVRDKNGCLRDLGTKGSGITPWSRGGDGRLTLKGGVREIIASEALHRLGVNTSRTLSLIETGEDLWRSDESSPARSSVMVRVAQTHLRFGTCERLFYLHEPMRLSQLLRHVIQLYYPHILEIFPSRDFQDSKVLENQILYFYSELVERIAKMVAQWMASGFVHGVLNTDNMSLVGESFDYGPYAFIDQWDPGFTAAYFDQTGLYSYDRQPSICKENLRLLQEPLAMLLPRDLLEERLQKYNEIFELYYSRFMHRRLGFDWNHRVNKNIKSHEVCSNSDLVQSTLNLLSSWPIGYGSFFTQLTQQILNNGLPEQPEDLLPGNDLCCEPPRNAWLTWRDMWWFKQHNTTANDSNERTRIPHRLHRWNLLNTPTRNVIEKLWEAIELNDDWGLFNAWLSDAVIKEY